MFGLRITTKRELALWNAIISDLRKENADLKRAVAHERKRAEGAINVLLAKTQGMVITSEEDRQTVKEMEEYQRVAMDLFDEEGQAQNEAELLEKIQS